MKRHLETLTKLYPDERRHPVIADNIDWHSIMPALDEVNRGHSILVSQGKLESAALILRIIAEIVYTMGYERAKQELTMPQFVVGESPSD